MDAYLVGGAVRDGLMRLPVKDRDWVVVGSSPSEMLERGFNAVGGDFPVFLHPRTNEEYALARTERKTAPGYAGFDFHAGRGVTLEQDLSRRDLTINAMARAADGTLIDPFGGRQDLASKIFRHVSPSFAEDPVRILRIARFSARHPDFTIAEETLVLMREMVDAGEVDALVPERIWKEISRGLMEQKPSRMLDVLRECGAMQRIFPELNALTGVPQTAEFHPEIWTEIHVNMVVDAAASLNQSLPVRFAAMCHDLGKGTTPSEMLPKHHDHESRSAALIGPVCDRWRVPNDLRRLAEVVAREHGAIHASLALEPGPTMRLLERCDAIRRPERFEEILLACECDARGRLGLEEREYPQSERLRLAAGFANSVDTADVARRMTEKGLAGPSIGAEIYASRVRAIHSGFEQRKREADPDWAQREERLRQNELVRRKIRHLRYAVASVGKPHSSQTLFEDEKVRDALALALAARSARRQPSAPASIRRVQP